MVANFITKDSFARIHSNNGSIYTVWILDEMTMAPIVVEVPLGLMGQYFKPSSHSIFPHLAMGTNV